MNSSVHTDLPPDLEHQAFQAGVEPTEGAHKDSTLFLDGLRGLAALSVLIQHTIGAYDLNVHEHGFGENGHYYFASLPFIRLIFSGGSAAVAIFFVLSGYVLSKSPLRLVRNGKRDIVTRRLASAVIRRPFRLYLPPLAVTLIWAITMHVPYDFIPEMPWPRRKATVHAELANWALESVKFFNPFRTHGSNTWFPYNLVVWTIPIELKGSILVFALTASSVFSNLPHDIGLALLAFTIVILLQYAKWTMACFVAGFFVCSIDTFAVNRAYLAGHITPRAQTCLWHIIFVSGGYFLSQPSHDGHPEYSSDTPGWAYLSRLIPRAYGDDQYYRYWHSWGAAMLVFAVLRIQWLQRLLTIRVLRYLGKVSFMLYLVHLPVIAVLGGRVGHMLGNVLDNEPDSWWNNRFVIPDVGPVGLSSRWLVGLAIILSVCLGLADAGTRWIDTPSVRIGKAIAQKLGMEDGRSQRTEAIQLHR